MAYNQGGGAYQNLPPWQPGMPGTGYQGQLGPDHNIAGQGVALPPMGYNQYGTGFYPGPGNNPAYMQPAWPGGPSQFGPSYWGPGAPGGGGGYGGGSVLIDRRRQIRILYLNPLKEGQF
ncbi:hypothetical protein PG987_007878 [Apiospora arundinis]